MLFEQNVSFFFSFSLAFLTHMNPVLRAAQPTTSIEPAPADLSKEIAGLFEGEEKKIKKLAKNIFNR